MENKRETLGKKLDPDGYLVITKRGRFFGDIGRDELQTALIMCTVDELAEVVKRARQFKRTKLYKKKSGLFYKHLSPDVSFGFLESSRDPWLCRREEKLKKAKKKTKKKVKKRKKK